MAQVSKYPIPRSLAERIFEVFLKSLVKTKSTNEAKVLADDLFTPVEKIMLAKRLGIAFLLLKGYSFREIVRILRVSLPTIALVNEKINYGSKGYQMVLTRVAKEEKIERFFEGILETLSSIPARSSKGGALWRNLRDESQKTRRKKEHLPV